MNLAFCSCKSTLGSTVSQIRSFLTEWNLNYDIQRIPWIQQYMILMKRASKYRTHTMAQVKYLSKFLWVVKNETTLFLFVCFFKQEKSMIFQRNSARIQIKRVDITVDFVWEKIQRTASIPSSCMAILGRRARWSLISPWTSWGHLAALKAPWASRTSPADSQLPYRYV